VARSPDSGSRSGFRRGTIAPVTSFKPEIFAARLQMVPGIRAEAMTTRPPAQGPGDVMAAEVAAAAAADTGPSRLSMRIMSGVVSGSPRRTFELQNFRSARCYHQAGIEKTGEPGCRHHGHDDGIHDAGAIGFGENPGIRVCAHSAGIRSLVSIEGALVVLGWFQSHGRAGPSPQRDKADSSPSRNSSITRGERQGFERFLHSFRFRRSPRLCPRPGIGLQHYRGSEVPQRVLRFLDGRSGCEASRREAKFLH